MPITEEQSERPRLPPLSSGELARIAGEHLRALTRRLRTRPSEERAMSMPRLRVLGRAIVLGWVSLVGTFTGAWRWIWSPRRLVGRWRAHLRLLAPSKTLSPWLFLLLAFAIVTGLVVLKVIRLGDPWKAVMGVLFGGAVVGVLALLWSDLFRCPWLGFRIRWRVRRHPECLLLPSLLACASELAPRPDLEIVPRTELYDEVLPGVLARDRKDVQVVVGTAGAGKTTALLGIAALLARIGVVPVLVPLRTEANVELDLDAKARFLRQVDPLVRSSGEAELLWRWHVKRRRIAILTDDIDQIGPDGERGFVLRQTLERAASLDLPVIVTARPAGVPAGVAASAIDLSTLDERAAVAHVLRATRQDASYGADAVQSERLIQEWVAAGELVEVPFYLELLAQLAAVGACPKLPGAGAMWTGVMDAGRLRKRADGEIVWNKLWVRFLLLEHYYEQLEEGRVRRSLGIEARERSSTLRGLERAALGTLVANSLATRQQLQERQAGRGAHASAPLRTSIRDFIDTDDRRGLAGHDEGTAVHDGAAGARRLRPEVSAHEVVDAGERLFLLDRDAADQPQFRHRIMQAYLAARCLARREYEARQPDHPCGRKRSDPIDGPPKGLRDWVQSLLDHHHPEKLTTHMTVTFAALRAEVEAQRSAASANGNGRVAPFARSSSGVDRDGWRKVVDAIVDALVSSAEQSMTGRHGKGAARTDDPCRDELEPMRLHDPENRADPDDALMKLTTAVEIANAVASPERDAEKRKRNQLRDTLRQIRRANGATRWTKLGAIGALDALAAAHRSEIAKERWMCVWEYARDADYEVRRAASAALQGDGYGAFSTLLADIELLIMRAAARSDRNRWLTRPEGDWRETPDGRRNGRAPADGAPRDENGDHDLTIWRPEKDILALQALGWVLPAIVSGFREDPTAQHDLSWRGEHGDAGGAGGPERPREGANGHGGDEDAARVDCSRRARRALESLVALAFEGGHDDLEAAVAQGFKGDAMRHAADPQRRISGPGWVTSNRRLVVDGLEHARYWYARMALYQALALYAIAGSSTRETFEVFTRHLRFGGRDRHPFTRRAARLARAAVRRHQLGSDRWAAYLWDDEGQVGGRRAATLSRPAAQLVADVTVLLNLNEGSAEDRQDTSVLMGELPHCLSVSRDRSEILGAGCPAACGWGLCPYKQPPPDEPNAHRGLSRAFCRQQRELARRRTRPPWQRAIKPRALRAFWRDMEHRARG